jgi:ABC-2 type transport system permease protein
MLEATILVGCFLCIIAAADSISGDRERASLEALLLTPTSRRQIVMGKYLSVLSLWPAALCVAIPYLKVLSQGTDIFVPAALWGMATGTILVSAVAALGMLISLWSNSLKTSMFAALGSFILIFSPFQLPGHAQTGPMGLLLQLLSPLMATFDFLARILVNNRALTDKARPVGDLLVWHHLISPVVFFLVANTILFFSAPGLALEAKRPRLFRIFRRGFATAALLGVVHLITAGPVNAQETTSKGAPIDIRIDKQFIVVGQGDSIPFHTRITNPDSDKSPPLTVAMNIINLDSKGDVVDPEDWSRQRTQYIDELAPGQAIDLKWTVNTIMDGDYMLYMVVIPKPNRPEATTQVVSSSGFHLTISPRAKLNPKGILLYILGTPVALILGMVYLNRRRRRATEVAGD